MSASLKTTQCSLEAGLFLLCMLAVIKPATSPSSEDRQTLLENKFCGVDPHLSWPR